MGLEAPNVCSFMRPAAGGYAIQPFPREPSPLEKVAGVSLTDEVRYPAVIGPFHSFIPVWGHPDRVRTGKDLF